MKRIVSVDIGSTYAKGALFGLAGGRLELLRAASAPTDSGNLASSFEELEKKLSGGHWEERPEFCLSSSAKGGLRIAAAGLTPSLTLEAAKLAALSAGALVVAACSYKLCDSDIERIKAAKPDIMLLCGGSDGGDESFAIFNARMLAEARLDAATLYAGNRAAAKKVSGIFAGREFHVADNVLPELHRPEPEGARERIRQIFLERIVRGRGLDAIVERTGAESLPTPCAMFEFLRGVYEARPDFGPFCAIDLGGATTDFYSCCPAGLVSPGALLKGLPEPEAKRSVEGDLGMRAGAASAAESMREFVAARLRDEGLGEDAFRDYVERAGEDRKLLPSSSEDKAFESVLAGACCAGALERHAGRCETAYLPEGKFLLQRGRNLRAVRRVVCTGGYLSRADGSAFRDCLSWVSKDQALLAPEEAELLVDKDYLLPLLANVFAKHPEAAVDAGLKSLKIAG